MCWIVPDTGAFDQMFQPLQFFQGDPLISFNSSVNVSPLRAGSTQLGRFRG